MTGRPVRLLVYQHPHAPFPEADYGKYMESTREYFEVMDTTIYPIEEGDEKLTVHDLRARE